MKAYPLILGLALVSGCISTIADTTPVKDICTGLTQIECNKNLECICKFGTEGDGVRIVGTTFIGCRLIGQNENGFKENKLACMRSGGYYLNAEMARDFCLYSNSTYAIKPEYFGNNTNDEKST